MDEEREKEREEGRQVYTGGQERREESDWVGSEPQRKRRQSTEGRKREREREHERVNCGVRR